MNENMAVASGPSEPVRSGEELDNSRPVEVKQPDRPEKQISARARTLRPTNTRALIKEAQTYQLQNFEKNAMLMFTQNYNIDGYDTTSVNKCDEDVLKETFSEFGFEVTVRNNKTKDGIMREVQEFCSHERDFTDYGCVAVVVLTIGSDEGFIKALDEYYSEYEIIHHFNVKNNPTLLTKPKILLIQARRDIATSNVLDIDDVNESYILPEETDLLVVHSSYIGQPQLRLPIVRDVQPSEEPENPQGTWFIRNLCSKIKELSPEQDLLSILGELMLEIEDLKEHDRHLRMPVTMSTLIRKLYLKKFGDAEIAHSTVNLQAASTSEMDSDTSGQATSKDIAPCACFLENFDYMKSCLRNYLEEHPDDASATLLDEANGLGEGEASFREKERMLAAISTHLKERTSDCDFAMCIHFYMENILCYED